MKKILNNKLGVLTILGGLLLCFKETNFVYPLLLIMIFWIYFNEMKDGRKKVSSCLKFLCIDAMLVTYVIWAGLVGKLNFIEDTVYREAIKVISFLIIYCVLYIVIAFSAEIKAARMTIFIITSVVSIVYLVLTTIINLIPLSEYTIFLSSYIPDQMLLDTLLKEYDGRVICNIVVQIIIYPMWVAALIGGMVIEGRSYCGKCISIKSILAKITNLE